MHAYRAARSQAPTGFPGTAQDMFHLTHTMRSLRSRSMDTLPKLEKRSLGTNCASFSDMKRACVTEVKVLKIHAILVRAQQARPATTLSQAQCGCPSFR